MDDAPDATGVYAPLAAQLRLRGILSQMQTCDALAVFDNGGQQVDTITAEERLDDGDRPWFYDCEGTPVAQVDDPIQAAITIVSNLRRSSRA